MCMCPRITRKRRPGPGHRDQPCSLLTSLFLPIRPSEIPSGPPNFLGSVNHVTIHIHPTQIHNTKISSSTLPQSHSTPAPLAVLYACALLYSAAVLHRRRSQLGLLQLRPLIYSYSSSCSVRRGYLCSWFLEPASDLMACAFGWSKLCWIVRWLLAAMETYTTDDALTAMGFGKFQALVLVYAGTGWLADSMELMLLSFVGPLVRQQWNVSAQHESLLSSVVFTGMLIGACSWGYISDKYGRR